MFIALFVAVLLWAVVVTFFWRRPTVLPLRDLGHRCFAVKDERTAVVVLDLIRQATKHRLDEAFTFDPGPTHQSLLTDGTTVIIHHDPAIAEKGLAPNAISLVVDDPMSEAGMAVVKLEQAGFEAKATMNLMPELGQNKFALVSSNAFDGWVLAFRRHVFKMGGPPKKRWLLPR